MLDECPVLSKHFSSAEEQNYLLFQLEVLETKQFPNKNNPQRKNLLGITYKYFYYQNFATTTFLP